MENLFTAVPGEALRLLRVTAKKKQREIAPYFQGLYGRTKFQTIMKHVFLILSLLAAMVSHAQPKLPLDAEGHIEFKKIIPLDSTAKASHFGKAKLWVANTFRSAQDVIQYESAQEGKLLCRGVFAINTTGMGANGTIHRTQAGFVSFTMEISIKDDRCRIRSYDLTHEAEYSGGNLQNIKPACGGLVMTVKTWNSIQLQTAERMEVTFLDFEKAMNTTKKDDF